MVRGFGNGGGVGDKVDAKLHLAVGRQAGKLIRKNVNKLTYDWHVVRNTRIQRFSSSQRNQAGKENRTSRTNKATRLKKRQDRLAVQGEATSKGKLALSNRTKHDTALKAVKMSTVLAKPIHPKDHVKVVHL